MPNEALINLHQNLAKDGYEVPDLDAFESQLANEEIANTLYENLTRDGYELPNIDEFKQGIGTPIKRNSAEFIHENLFEELEKQRAEDLKKSQEENNILTESKKPRTEDDGASFANYQVKRAEKEKAIKDDVVALQKSFSEKASSATTGLPAALRARDKEELAKINDPILRMATERQQKQTFDQRYEEARELYYNGLMQEFAHEVGVITDKKLKVQEPDLGAKEEAFKIFTDQKFIDADPDDREDMIQQSWETYRKKAGLDKLDAQSQKERREQFMYDAMQEVYMKDDLYTPSIAGLKSKFADMQALIAEELKAPEMVNAMAVASAQQMGPGAMPLITKMHQEVSEEDRKKYQALSSAQMMIDDLMRIPENKEKMWTELWKGLSNGQFYDRLPFISSTINAQNLARVYTIGKKVENGKPITEDDQNLLEAFGALHQATGMQPKSRMFNVGNGLANMIPYMGEFAATMPIFTAQKKVAEAGMTRFVEKQIGKKVTEAGTKYAAKSLAGRLGASTSYELAIKPMAYMVGALAQTSANPQMVANNTIERMTPEVSLALSPEGLGMVVAVDNNGESFGTAFAKGFGMSYAEIFTETLGPKLMGTGGYMMNKITGGKADDAIKYMAQNNEWFKRVIMGGWMRKNGIVEIDDAIKRIAEQNLGWNGIIEEYMEEFANGRMTDLITGDNEKAKTRVGALMPWNYSWDQEFETLLTVGAFGLAPAVARTAKMIGEGTNTAVRYSVGSKEVKTKVPKQMLSLAVSAGMGSAESATRLVNEYTEGNLSDQQIEALALVAQNTMDKQRTLQTAIEKIKKEKEKADEKGPQETPAEEPKAEDEKAGIKDEAGQSEDQIPDALRPLAEVGLLKKDDKGNPVAPTAKEVQADMDVISANLEDAIKNSDQAEIDRLGEQMEALTEYQKTLTPEKSKAEKKKKEKSAKKESVPPIPKESVNKKTEESESKSEEKPKRKSPVNKRLKDWAGSLDQDSVIDGDLVGTYEKNKDQVPEEEREAFDAYIEKLKGAIERMTGKPAGNQKIQPDRNGPPIQKQFRGKVVYASTNTGKTTFASTRSDVKDADEVLKEVLRESGIQDDRIDSDPGLVAYENQSPKLHETFRNRLQEYADQGYTVLTSNNFSRWSDFPAVAFLAETPERQAAKVGQDRAERLFAQERKVFKEHRIVPEGQYIGELLTAPEEDRVLPGAEEKVPIFNPSSVAFKNFKSAAPKTEEEIQAKIKESIANIADVIASQIGAKKNLQADFDEPAQKVLIQNIKDFVDALIELGIYKLKEVRRRLRAQLMAQDDFDKYQVQETMRVFDENQSAIQMYLQAAKAMSKGKAQMKSELSILFNNAEAFNGENTLDTILKTYKDIWIELAEVSGASREFAEKTFFNFAKQGPFSNVTNENEYVGFIAFYKQFYEAPKDQAGRVMKQMLEILGRLNYSQAISLFRTYESLELVEQIGLFPSRNNVEFRTLNSSEDYYEFESRFLKHYPKFKYGENAPGIASVVARLKDYEKERKIRFSISGTKPTGKYYSATPEERYEMRKEQFNSDLKLLQDLTGLSMNTWRHYFGPQTNETKVTVWRDGKEVVETFGTYDEMLREDTKHMGYVRVHSNLTRILHLNVVTKNGMNLKAAESEFRKYFLEGYAEGKALNNLYKLYTASPNKVGLSGRSVTGNRFNSFIRSSDLMTAARNFHYLVGKNHIADKYKSQSRIPIKIFNGIRSGENSVESDKMTMRDFWLSSVSMFLMGESEYEQVISQFSDKPTIYTAAVDKLQIDKEWIKTNGLEAQFKESVDFIYDIIRWDTSVLKNIMGPISDKPARDLAESFAYNWMRNIGALNEIFFGDRAKYGNDLKMSKRAGSTSSPGTELNIYAEGGVGPTFRHVEFNEWKHDIDGMVSEVFDGVAFISGAMAKKMAVSMGETYADLEEYNGILDSTKALYSVQEGGSRGLTKVNFVNIDVLAESLGDKPGGEVFAKIKKFMDENQIDTASFYGSGTKLLEKGAPITVFDEKGKFDASSFKEENVIVRNTEHLRIQQDLRHSMIPQKKKMSIQFVANILGLPAGRKIVDLITKLQMSLIQEFTDTLLTDKTEWVKTHLSEDMQKDLVDLLDQGAEITEPASLRLFYQLMASHYNKTALDIPVDRVMSQEIPSIPGMLKGYRESADGSRILPAQVAVGITGIRYAQKMESREKAIAHVKANPSEFDDLFDDQKNLKEWEFEDDGMIPGEYVIVTRIPADDLHSHTVGRATYQIGANMVMIDKESQLASGSDYDGDQRSIQVLSRKWKDGKRVMVSGENRKALANKIILLTAEEYSDPVNKGKITAPINLNAYDGTVNEIRKGKGEKNEGDFDLRNIADFSLVRQRNIAGVQMKAIMANLSSTFSYARAYGLRMKAAFNWVDGQGNKIRLSKVVNDKNNLVKVHIGNLLNLAFDNAKDPKIEDLGLTPETANMFVLLLMMNDNIDAVDQADTDTIEKTIVDQVDIIAKYFNQPHIQYLIQNTRLTEGGFPVYNQKQIVEFAKDQWKDKAGEIDDFINLQKAGRGLFRIKSYQQIMHEAPLTSADYIRTLRNIQSIQDNKTKYFDTTGFMPTAENPFQVVTTVMSELFTAVFSDLPEFSTPGEKIIEYIKASFKEQEGNDENEFYTNHLDYVIRLLHNVIAIKSVDNGLSYGAVRKETFDLFNKEYDPDNLFFRYVVKSESTKEKPVQMLGIREELRFSRLPEDVLDSIHKDFDLLSDELKMALARYVFYNYGPTVGNMNYNFYNLFSNKFRAELSRSMQSELNRWNNDRVGTVEMFSAAEWIRRASIGLQARIQLQKSKFSESLSNDGFNILDINSSPSAQYLLNMEAMEDIASGELSDEEGANLMRQLGGDVEIWTGLLAEKNLDPVQTAKSIVARLESIANKTMGHDVRNHVPEHEMEELLLTEDEALSSYIFDQLQKAYPGLAIFESREAFEAFAQRAGANGFTSDPEAVGHAISNGIFIDPERAVQSTPIHEMAHIYWAMLPASHPAKVALEEHFGDGKMTSEELEERIVLAIGYAGVGIIEAEMKGPFWNKFRNLLKRFWNAVKQVLSKASKEDYIWNMAYDVIKNQRKIDMTSIVGPQVVKNMAIPSGPLDADGKPDAFRFGKKHTLSVTRMISSLQASEFDSSQAAQNMAMLNALEFKKEYNISSYESEKLADQNRILKKWEFDSMNGTALHDVIASIIDPENNEVKETDRFLNDAAMDEFKESVNKAIEYYREKFGPNITFRAEQSVVSEYDISAKIDLIIDLENGHKVIVDFKTGNEAWFDEEGKPLEKYTRETGRWNTSALKRRVSKFLVHSLQVNSYANILEEEKDIEGVQVNVVDGVYVHQIVIDIVPTNEQTLESGTAGKIRKATFLPQAFQHMRRAADPNVQGDKGTPGLVRSIMAGVSSAFKKMNSQLSAYARNLADAGYMDHIIQEQLAALNYFASADPQKPLDQITVSDIERLTGTGWGPVEDILLMNGFSPEQLQSMNTEARFYAYIGNRAPDEIFEDATSTKKNPALFKKFTVRKKTTRRRESFQALNTEVHTTIDGKDFYLKNASVDNLKVGDEVVEAFPWEDSLGNKETRKRKYTVARKAKGSILLTDSQTNEGFFIPLNEKNPTFYKVIDKPSVPVEKNSYKQTHIMTTTEQQREHYELAVLAKGKDLTDEDQERYMRQARVVWAFFDKYSTPKDIQALFQDRGALQSEYDKLRVVDSLIGGGLIGMLQKQLFNHIVTDTIRAEIKGLEKRTTAMDQTLHLYRIMARPNEAFSDLGGGMAQLAYYLTPSRMMRREYSPLNFFTLKSEEKIKDATYELIQFKRNFEKHINEAEKAGTPIREEMLWVERNGVKVFRNPDDKTVSLSPYEKNFLTYILTIYGQRHPDFIDRMTLSGGAAVPIPRVFILREEARRMFPRKYGSRIHDLLRPEAYDSVKLKFEVDGRTVLKTLRQIKNMFAEQHLDIATNQVKDPEQFRKQFGNRIRNILGRMIPLTKGPQYLSASELYSYVRQAKRIYSKGNDTQGNNPNLKDRISRLPISGKSSSVLVSNRLIDATKKTLMESIERFFLADTVPIYEVLRAQYTAENSVLKYLDDTFKIRILKQNPGINKEYADPGAKEITEWILKLNSLAKIAYSLGVQKANLLVGQANDIIREPVAYGTGMWRIMTTKNGIKKAYNIAVSSGLANLSTEEEFRQTVEGWVGKVENYGYKFMDLAEKANQLPIYIGLMTKEEWDGFNTDGTKRYVKNKQGAFVTTAPDSDRRAALENRVQEIHGDYTRAAAAPYMFTTPGRFFWQFGKFIPAVMAGHFRGHHLNRRHEISAGMIRSIELIGRLAIYKSGVSAVKAKMLAAAARQSKESGTEFNNTREYFNFILSQQENGQMRFKAVVSKADQNNYIRLALEVAMVLILMAAKGDDDDPTTETTLERLFNDLVFFLSPEFWSYKAKSPIPAVQYGIDVGTLASQLISQEAYERDTKTAKEGWKKWWITSTRVVPGGGMFKDAIRKGLEIHYKRDVLYDQDGKKVTRHDLIKSQARAEEVYNGVLHSSLTDETREELLAAKDAQYEVRKYANDQVADNELLKNYLFLQLIEDQMKDDPAYKKAIEDGIRKGAEYDQTNEENRKKQNQTTRKKRKKRLSEKYGIE